MKSIKIMRSLILSSIFLFLNVKNAIAVSYHWLQLVNENQMWLRYVDDKIKECPIVSVDGEDTEMNVFSEKSAEFPLSCKISFDLDHLPKVIQINEKQINVKFDRNHVKKIALIGDTGCRVKNLFSQDCQKHWYFEKIANLTVAHNPDLVIHVGDYIYREKGYKDVWSTWEEDFFKPASKLLNSDIPFIMVRGNHENCKRNGNGWFNLLSIDNKECKDYSPMYSVNINNIECIVTDSTLNEKLVSDINQINAANLDKDQYWILTHRPIVHYDANGLMDGYIKAFKSLNDKIKMIISGHVHLLQLIRDEHRVQVIAGNSGTLLSGHIGVTNDHIKKEYGFSIIELEGCNITLTGFNKENKQILKKIL